MKFYPSPRESEMKLADNSESEEKAKWSDRLKRANPTQIAIALFCLISLPLTIIGVNLGLRAWNERTQLNAAYQYPFSRPAPGTIRLELEKEIGFYQKRIQNNPNDGLDRAALAKTYLKMARVTGDASWYLLAEQSAQLSLAKLPFDNDSAILVMARIAEAQHNFAEAIRLAEQASGNEDALGILVTSKLAIGEIEQAEKAANTLVERIPTLSSLTLRALVKVAQGKDAEAIEDFEKAIAIEEYGETGSSVWARTLLGRLYYKRGQLKAAKALYQESLKIIPQYSPALLNLAQLQIRQGNYRAAERIYSQFFQVSQQSSTVYDHVVWRGLARVKERLGDESKAASWRDEAEARLREDLSGFGHRRELAQLLLERGHSEDIKEALELMQTEVRSRRDADTLATLALALSQSGDRLKAQQTLREALRWGIRDAGLFYQAGLIEQALGNQSEAIAYFQRATETDPTFDERAKAALGLGIGLGQ